jgi:dynein heavy chain
LNEKGLQNYIEDIEDMSDRAQREYRLMVKLTGMQREWEDKVLELKDHKETYIISTIEDVQTLLDDQVVTAQAMKTSRYIKPVEGKCREWEARLLLVQETLDEWIKC